VLLLQVMIGELLLGANYALFSAGLTLIWGMLNFINFAHGEFVMLGMYAALLTVMWFGGGSPRGDTKVRERSRAANDKCWPWDVR